MLDLTPFLLRPDAELSPAWLRWLGAALRADAGPAELAAPPGALTAPLVSALAAHGLTPSSTSKYAIKRARKDGRQRSWPR